MDVLVLNDLAKQYGKKNALKDLNMNVNKGDIYALVGQNGAGKTTCMRICGGLAKYTSGSLSIMEKKYIKRMPEGVGKRIGLLIDGPGLFMNMSGYDNLRTKCILMKQDKAEYIRDLLQLVSLEKDKDKKVKYYSLGMKQRLAIAMALVDDPDFLILDEPINGLDPQGILLIRKLILSLNKEKGMTFLISSHILTELSIIASKYGFIKDGRMLIEISSDKLVEVCKAKEKTLEEYYFEQMGTEIY